ncbi:ribbon-helix-helix protein, CopG family [Haloarcula salina]|uniref:Ribbon-helix-helix protein, CopG family n=1 Tax=Haloarcula salina TaxID=1429914 RepID=A0AA41KJB7_9EURY|nr:ribbon-helix-helix protein, CopG family [Haloarcula salina]MBV0903701.1 ribbon-helix-helix protein, CopG family [Haloarcula salina]
MDEAFLDLESVDVELEEELLEAIDEKAFADHRDNRDAAIRDLLDEWLKERAAAEAAAGNERPDADTDDESA